MVDLQGGGREEAGGSRICGEWRDGAREPRDEGGGGRRRQQGREGRGQAILCTIHSLSRFPLLLAPLGHLAEPAAPPSPPGAEGRGMVDQPAPPGSRTRDKGVEESGGWERRRESDDARWSEENGPLLPFLPPSAPPLPPSPHFSNVLPPPPPPPPSPFALLLTAKRAEGRGGRGETSGRPEWRVGGK